jgi:hypothetical protein
MNPRNEAFFGLYENLFLVLKERMGGERALELFRTVMERGLEKAYGTGFEKGNPHEFARVVGERDAAAGLRVEFPEVREDRIVYRFLDDPFPNLRGHVDPEKLDATYLRFKVSHLLGEGWTYQTLKHLWRGDGYTEHVITRTVRKP